MFGANQASTGFSFGSTSAPGFGGAASSAPAFGASSTPAFGGTPAFGAATSTPAFGASSSNPAFGAPSGGGFNFGSTPALGASSTPAFGFSSTPAFGASSTPAFGQSAPQPSLFAGFGQQPAQQPQPQQQQQQQQVPFTRDSRFESLPQDMQRNLQQIQEQINKYNADSLKVRQLQHLQEAPQQQGLDADIAAVRGELKELSGLIKAQEEGLQDFKEKSQKLLKATDTVVKVYSRNREWRQNMQLGQPVDLSKVLQEPFQQPGPFLEEAVHGMVQMVGEYSRVLDEVEQVLATSRLQDPSQVDWRTVLPTIVSNMHDYFIAVAAKLERTHTEVEHLKPIYLAHRRAQGDYTDPFERARRQEQLQLQHQQQRPAGAGAGAAQQHAAPPAAAAAGAMPALPAPPTGGLFGAQTPATPPPQGTPGMGAGSFGSPFLQAGTPLGASPFGGNANAGLSRSASKPKSKKR